MSLLKKASIFLIFVYILQLSPVSYSGIVNNFVSKYSSEACLDQFILRSGKPDSERGHYWNCHVGSGGFVFYVEFEFKDYHPDGYLENEGVDYQTPLWSCEAYFAWLREYQPEDEFSNCIEHRFYEIPINNGKNCSQSANFTKNPINIVTGSKYFEFTDYQSQNKNGLTLQRFHNSQTGNTTRSWSFSYSQWIEFYADFIVAHQVDGRSLVFNAQDLSAYSNHSANLTFNNDEYYLSFPNRTVEKYDINGRLLSITFPSGKVHTIEYINGWTAKVTTGSESLTFTYSGPSTTNPMKYARITTALLPDGETINYLYLNGNIESVNFGSGETEKYFYRDAISSFITGIEDRNGNRINSVSYDSEGRAILSELGPEGSGIERAEIEYHDYESTTGGSRTVTNALGKKTTYHFTVIKGKDLISHLDGHPTENCDGANQAYTYDSNGFMASKTDWQGTITTYVHNDRGQELSRTEASGTPQARTITTEWHPQFNLPVRITGPERETVMAYDDRGRLLSRESRPANRGTE